MSVQWSLSGEKQTWAGLPISVAIDPQRTSPVLDNFVPEAPFGPFRVADWSS